MLRILHFLLVVSWAQKPSIFLPFCWHGGPTHNRCPVVVFNEWNQEGEKWEAKHEREPMAKKERERGEVGGGEGRGGREGRRRRKSSREYNSQQRAVRMMGSCGGLQSPCKAFILSVPSVWMCHSAYFYFALRRFWGLQPCPGTHPGILRLKIIKEGWEEERRAKTEPCWWLGFLARMLSGGLTV